MNVCEFVQRPMGAKKSLYILYFDAACAERQQKARLALAVPVQSSDMTGIYSNFDRRWRRCGPSSPVHIHIQYNELIVSSQTVAKASQNKIESSVPLGLNAGDDRLPDVVRTALTTAADTDLALNMNRWRNADVLDCETERIDIQE